MKKFIYILFIALIFASFFFGRYTKAEREIIKTDTVKVVRIDTFRLTVLKPYRVIIKDTIQVPITDTLRINDTLFINLPREQKTYKDSTYKAVISGFKPNLDSLEIYKRTITNTITVTEKAKKYGIGVIGGVGYSDKVRPFIGLGFYYKLY